MTVFSNEHQGRAAEFDCGNGYRYHREWRSLWHLGLLSRLGVASLPLLPVADGGLHYNWSVSLAYDGYTEHAATLDRSWISMIFFFKFSFIYILEFFTLLLNTFIQARSM